VDKDQARELRSDAVNQGLVLLLGWSELAIVLGVLAYFLLRGRGS
jgi:hypothetical protein